MELGRNIQECHGNGCEENLNKIEAYYDLQAKLCRERSAHDGAILEVGCGKGNLLRRLSKIGSYKVGIDVSKATVNEARINLKMERGIHLVVGTAEALPFRNETFGAIILFEVLEHLENPRRAIRKISRCLKTNGRLLSITLNYYGLRNFVVQMTKSLKIEEKYSPPTFSISTFSEGRNF